MSFFSKKRKRHVPSDENEEEVPKCKECRQEKKVLWDCAWNAGHLICSSCAAGCTRCGKYYCDDCRVVLVFCDSCDAMFCPDCKPRTCVCIIPRMATCFMINFKKKTSEDLEEEESSSSKRKKAMREVSDSSATTTTTVPPSRTPTPEIAARMTASNESADRKEIELVCVPIKE